MKEQADKSCDEQQSQAGISISSTGLLQKQKQTAEASTRRGSKAPPSVANLSLVLPRPLVRPSQAEKKGRKGNLEATSGNNLQASSSKNLQASSCKNLQGDASKKLQASSSKKLQAKSNKKTNVQCLSNVPNSLDNDGRQLRDKENQSLECNPINFSKTDSSETLGEDVEVDLRRRLALRKTPMTNSKKTPMTNSEKTPMTNSERQLLQLDSKTDWTLWEKSCLADKN